MKNKIIIIISLMFGLGGIFWFLVAREEIKEAVYKKEKEMRAKKMENDITGMIALVNGSKKPKMVKC